MWQWPWNPICDGDVQQLVPIFYARKIFRRTGNFTFVVATDREDLDGSSARAQPAQQSLLDLVFRYRVGYRQAFLATVVS